MDLYHVLNRGVDKRVVFLEEADYVRFIRNMFVFNDENPAPTNIITRDHNTDMRKPRSLLVDIHAFCLMPNHYHIILSERVEGGASLFMHKLNMGYSRHFNEKYDRVGALWQGKYKKILIEKDGHFLYIPYYIHLNPLDLTMPEWRSGEIKNFNKALKELSNYRWSSHLDYLGEQNFPSVTNRTIFSELLGSEENYKKELKNITSNSIIASNSKFIE